MREERVGEGVEESERVGERGSGCMSEGERK